MKRARKAKKKKHTTGGIPRWSPTLVLVARFSAYVWQSGRDAQFSLTYGRMYYGADTMSYNVLYVLRLGRKYGNRPLIADFDRSSPENVSLWSDNGKDKIL
jgi:hypothetical protein